MRCARSSATRFGYEFPDERVMTAIARPGRSLAPDRRSLSFWGMHLP